MNKMIKVMIIFFSLFLFCIFPNVKATTNEESVDFSIKTDANKLTLGEEYSYIMETNNFNLRYCYIIIKFDPTMVDFTSYNLRNGYDVFMYNDDEVEGILSITFNQIENADMNDSSFEEGELIKFNFIAKGIGNSKIELEFLKHGYNLTDNIFEEKLTYVFNIEDKNNYTNFINSVKLIDSTKLLTQFDQIKLAIIEVNKFNNGVLGTKEATDYAHKLEGHINNYNELIDIIETVSSNADLVAARVGGK